MRERLEEMGLSYAKLAERTGDDLKRIEEWLGPKGRKIPAEFAARFCEATGTDGNWLLTGVGSHERDDARISAYARGVDEATGPYLRVMEDVRAVRGRAGLPWPGETNPPPAPPSDEGG